MSAKTHSGVHPNGRAIAPFLQRMLYRAFRLRRLILLSVAVTSISAVFSLPMRADVMSVAAIFAVGLPVSHALRYPLVWIETANVALTVAVMIVAFALLGWHEAIVDVPIVVRLFCFSLAGCVLFVLLTTTYDALLHLGKPRQVVARGALHSQLDAATLSQHLVLRPNTEDGFLRMGAQRDDGTIPFMNMRDPVVAEGKLDEQFQRGRWSDLEGVDPWAVGYIKVLTSTDETVETVTLAGDNSGSIAGKLTLTPQADGTRIELAEYGLPSTGFERLGFWLQDFMADYLRDRIDQAEDKPARCLRTLPVRMLIADIARFFPDPDAVNKGAT